MTRRFKLFGNDSLRDKIVCGFAVVLFSMVLFIYFSAQNINDLSLRTVGMLSLILLPLAVISYVLSLIVLRKPIQTFVFCSVFWLGFYLRPLMQIYLGRYWPWYYVGYHTYMITIILAVLLALLLSFRFRITIKAVNMFIAVFAVVFVINFNVLIHDSTQEYEAKNTMLPIKKDFIVDEKTQSPNIYWIHADGMLNFDTVKKYYFEGGGKIHLKLS